METSVNGSDQVFLFSSAFLGLGQERKITHQTMCFCAVFAEFDYVAALENAPTPPSRPLIKYDLMAVSKFIQRGEANPLDNVVFSQFPSKTDDLKYLQAAKARLSKASYEYHFDVNGPENRMELKKKLAAILSFSEQDMSLATDEKNDQKHEPFNGDSPIVGTYVTPDSSHFQQPHPNAEFLTPSFAEHLIRQKDAAITPSNVPIFKPLSPGYNPPFNSSPHQSSQSGTNNPSSPSPQQPWGIYNSLTYSSMMIAEVFAKMFSKTAMAKPVQENVIKSSNHTLLKPVDRNLCSRFVEDVSFTILFFSMQTYPLASQSQISSFFITLNQPNIVSLFRVSLDGRGRRTISCG